MPILATLQRNQQRMMAELEGGRSPSSLGVERGEVMSKRLEVASMGTVGYIPVDLKFWEIGTMMDWGKPVAAVLGKAKKFAFRGSLFCDLTATVSGNGPRGLSAPALIPFFTPKGTPLRACWDTKVPFRCHTNEHFPSNPKF